MALFVGAGFMFTAVAQADQPTSVMHGTKQGRYNTGDEKWWQSVWGLDLARKLKNWHPRITVRNDGEGLNLAHPFGKSGPTVQCSSSLPDTVKESLRAAGGSHIDGIDRDTDVFVFLQQRW